MDKRALTEKAKKDRLIKFCRKFVKTNEISCGETIYQADHVIESAHEFIEGVCNIVGYHNETTEEE